MKNVARLANIAGLILSLTACNYETYQCSQLHLKSDAVEECIYTPRCVVTTQALYERRQYQAICR